MTTAQITLSDTTCHTLNTLAEQTGRSRDDLLREAVEEFLTRHHRPDRLQLLQQARGIRSQRADLPNLDTMRREMDRF